MSRVITFSTKFPAYHPKAGQPTYFVEKFRKSRHLSGERPIDIECEFSEEIYFMCEPKHHTIRAGHHWKKGDCFSPRVWSGKPYNSKQIVIAPDTLITDCWDVVIFAEPYQTTICLPTEIHSQYQMLSLGEVAKNDGLTIEDFESWFNPKRKSIEFQGQIICWNPQLKY